MLGYNNFTSTIPTLLGKLDDITHLSLRHNALTGPIPSELGTCFRLVALHLDNNKLSGSIPPELEHLSALESMFLDTNQMQDISMPPQVCSLRQEELSELSADCAAPSDGGETKVSCDCCTSCM
jgi:Leucine-rich repeat (LRR) protein